MYFCDAAGSVDDVADVGDVAVYVGCVVDVSVCVRVCVVVVVVCRCVGCVLVGSVARRC